LIYQDIQGFAIRTTNIHHHHHSRISNARSHLPAKKIIERMTTTSGINNSHDEQPTSSLELLTRKVAKCDRILEKHKQGTITNKDYVAKLKKKRSEYVLQLGELAYQAALASSMVVTTTNATTNDTTTSNDTTMASPTTVTDDKRLDPATFQNFDDSLAIFDQSAAMFMNHVEDEEDEEITTSADDAVVMTHESYAVLEQGDEEEEASCSSLNHHHHEKQEESSEDDEPMNMKQLLQSLPDGNVDEDEDDSDDSAPVHYQMYPVVATDEEDPIPAGTTGTTTTTTTTEDVLVDGTQEQDISDVNEDDHQVEDSVEDSLSDEEDKGILKNVLVGDHDEEDEEGAVVVLPVQDQQEAELPAVAAHLLEEDEEAPDCGADKDEQSVEPEEPLRTALDATTTAAAQDATTSADLRQDENKQEDTPSSAARIENEMDAQQQDTTISENDEPAPLPPPLIGSPSSMTVSSSQHSSTTTAEFDGEGSVNKLRAMFDSPTVDGEKPRRSWRPKQKMAEEMMIPSAHLANSAAAATTTTDNSDDTADDEPPTVTMKVQEGTGASLQSSVVTLHQAVMTSSVHEIDSPLVALVSLFPESMYEYLPKQNRALLIFAATFGHLEEEGKEYPIIYVDGSNPKERERRNELFELSGAKRGVYVYPLLFVRKQNTGKLEFFADFDKIELLNDCQTLKEEIEKASSSSSSSR
jgi:hypothetical protein